MKSSRATKLIALIGTAILAVPSRPQTSSASEEFSWALLYFYLSILVVMNSALAQMIDLLLNCSVAVLTIRTAYKRVMETHAAELSILEPHMNDVREDMHSVVSSGENTVLEYMLGSL